MNLYWDYENQKLMDGLNSGQQIQRLTMILRDQVDVTLYVMKLNIATQLNELVDCPAGQAPLFGLKGTTQAQLAGDYLAVQPVWTKTATGTYVASIDLATDELAAELGTSTSAALTGEFTLRDAGAKDHFSTQVNIVMNYDVNGDGEGVTHPAYWGSLVREEVVDGDKVLILYNSDGVEYARFTPPGV